MKMMKSLGLMLGLSLACAATAKADTSDFALFKGADETSGAVCSANSSFVYNVAVANVGGDGQVRITFKDGNFIEFPIVSGASFAFSQAAGSKGRADRAIRVSNGGSFAQLSGSMSASGQGNPKCISCDADSSGDFGCDKVVPN
jgi:hypothetical protein